MLLLLLLWSSPARAESETDNVAALERQVHELVNNHRAQMGLEPLSYSEDIAAVARRHSRDMARGYVGMGHEGAESRGSALARVITFTQFAENIGANNHSASSTARTAVAGWLNSPGHRANLEGKFDLTGIGIVRSGETFFFTQIFLTTRSSSRPPLETRRPRERGYERNGATAGLQPDEPLSRKRRAYVPADEEGRDPRQRPGRKRVRGGYVQDLDEGH
jgi:hypothetical protein